MILQTGGFALGEISIKSKPSCFAILIACGFGLPLPEDIPLITSGILAASGVIDFWGAVTVGMVGVLLGDFTIHMIGRKGGKRLKGTKVYRKIMNDKREKKVIQMFDRYGDKVIFFARFAPGLRMPLFLTSGIYRVPVWEFLALDGFAAAISVPVWVWVGNIFGDNLEVLNDKIKQVQGGTYIVLGSLLFIIIAYYWIKKKVK